MIQLHELEAARRALPHLFPGPDACCMLEWSEGLCPNCLDMGHAPLKDNPIYRTIEAVLDHYLEDRTSSSWCSLCARNHTSEGGRAIAHAIKGARE